MKNFIIIAVMSALLSATSLPASNSHAGRMPGGPVSSGTQAIRQTCLYYECPRRGDARRAIPADPRALAVIDPETQTGA